MKTNDMFKHLSGKYVMNLLKRYPSLTIEALEEIWSKAFIKGCRIGEKERNQEIEA